MQKYRDESEIYNYQRIQLSNNKFINVILGGTLDLIWLRVGHSLSQNLTGEFMRKIDAASKNLFTDN